MEERPSDPEAVASDMSGPDIPRILVADDDAIGRTLVSGQLRTLGYDVVTAGDGEATWDALQAEDPPRVVVLDWMMPGLDGVEICRRLTLRDGGPGVYVIMLTSRDSGRDLAEALDAGADDYITKPFDAAELQARVQVGCRVVALQRRLKERVQELEETLARVRELQSLLPICSYCRQIRDDKDYWHSIEDYFSRHAEVRFSHGICPDCVEKHWGGMDDDEPDSEESHG